MFFSSEVPQDVKAKPPIPGVFSTDDIFPEMPYDRTVSNAIARTFQREASQDTAAVPTHAMDEAIEDTKALFQSTYTGISASQIAWYSSQGFIGYQMCAMLAQHWLIAKCCLMPADDAVRKGYEITVNDGSDVGPEVLDAIKAADVKFRINTNLVEFINLGRVFGIRIAMFKVESDDEAYYEKPFNLDGVTPGSYRGIVQIDPYWVTPELDAEAASDPSSMYFYEPTWWRINGRRYHRTHLMIMRNGEVSDILKPTYLYGGISVPQKIYERVYAAERTANEAPQLALTKRATVVHVDLMQFIANQASAEKRMQQWAYYRDNYGIKILGLEETAEQFDTSLADLDAVIMTQYQIVAAACNTPATKLMGTTPKGFNSTGEAEESSYHEELESIRSHSLTPFLARHHEILIRSEIVPQFNIPVFNVSVTWNPLDAITAEELAKLNKDKADTDAVLVSTGAIDGQDVRNRVINDQNSGYNGIDSEESIESDPDAPPIDTETLNDPEEGEMEPTSGPKTDKTPGLITQGD